MIAGASGSVGGTTFSRNRYGAYARYRAVPVNPSSTKQQIIRSTLGNLAQTWKGLTSSQRLEWNTQAPNVQLVDALGQPYNPTGFQFYVGINSTLLHLGGAQVTNPPANPTQQVVLTGSATAVGSTGVVTITYTPAITGTNWFILRGSAPRSPGVNYIGRSAFKDLAYLLTANASPYTATTAWASTFGSLTTADVGKRITFQLVPVSSTGFRGVPFAFSANVS
jgi:hypothetical protein